LNPTQKYKTLDMDNLNNNQNFKRLLFLRYKDDLIIGVVLTKSTGPKNNNKQKINKDHSLRRKWGYNSLYLII